MRKFAKWSGSTRNKKSERREAAIAERWRVQILPQWQTSYVKTGWCRSCSPRNTMDCSKHTFRVSQMAKAGIPPTVRSQVWATAAGNEMNVRSHAHAGFMFNAHSMPANERGVRVVCCRIATNHSKEERRGPVDTGGGDTHCQCERHRSRLASYLR